MVYYDCKFNVKHDLWKKFRTKCENAPFFMIALDILGTIQLVENPDLCIDVVNSQYTFLNA